MSLHMALHYIWLTTGDGGQSPMKSRFRRCALRVAAIASVVIAISTFANALEGIQSPYLKGYRDFMTGVLGSPGLYVRHDLYMYSGSEHSTIPQGQLHVGFKAIANIVGASYVTPHEILGGNYAFSVRGAFSDIQADQSLIIPRPRLRQSSGAEDSTRSTML